MTRHLVPIGDVVEINPKIPACITDDMDASAAFLPMAGVSEGGRVIAIEVRKVREVVNGYRYFAAGDVLMAKITPCMENGKAAVVENLPYAFGFGSTEFHVLRSGPEIHNRYLFHFVWSSKFRHAAERNMTGTAGQKRVPASYLECTLIPLPSFEEQKRIAAILDKADAIRQKRQESLRLTDEFLRSVFLEMFGDPIRNPREWKQVALAELGSLDRGVSKHRPRNAPELLTGPYPLIQTGDVANSGGYIRRHSSTYSELGLKQSKLWPAGTLCITIAANIASTGILTYDACFPDSVVGFTANQTATVEFVQTLLGFFRQVLDDKAPQVAQKNINLKVLRELIVPRPPLQLQRTFSEIVRQSLLGREKAMLSASELDRLFSALQNRAFSGDL